MSAATSLPADTAALATTSATKNRTTTTTAAEPPPPTYYPQYCFHLSPTLNRWCPMRIADVACLDKFAEFEGQNVFFHRNHPIKWVRVAGVVVASDDYYGRRVYTVDDGSGVTLECVLPKDNMAVKKDAQEAEAVCPGTVVDVRGGLHVYRDVLQIGITRLSVLHATAQEVQFWAKVQAFARDTLRQPWTLDRHVVRTCRRAAKEQERRKDGGKAGKAGKDKKDTKR